jgi:hypothetical protein
MQYAVPRTAREKGGPNAVCGANCEQGTGKMRCEQGTGPEESRGTKGQRPKTWAQGGAATEQVHGAHLQKRKTADQRLSYCGWTEGWCWGATPQMPKCAFWHSESPLTHNTRTATHCRHHIAQCHSLLGAARWRRLGRASPAAQRNQNEWAHDTAKTEVSGSRSGTWDAAGGRFNGT